MSIIKHRTLFFSLTGALIVLALLSLIFFGLKFSIDFTGGTLVEVAYSSGRPPAGELDAALKAANITGFSLREANANEYILRAPALTAQKEQALPQTLSVAGQYAPTIVSLSEIGPSIGAELRAKAILAILSVCLAILLFIAFAFRKVSRPVSSWVYGLVALATLVHDVIIPAGFFAMLGHFTGAAVDSLFVTALLTVLGFSVHDTIVVFDRVRENLRLNGECGRKESFGQTTGRSLSQTFTRSINTSLTVALTLLVLYFWGPASTQYFALTLLVGIIAGTYSSIFLATPLLVAIETSRSKKK